MSLSLTGLSPWKLLEADSFTQPLLLNVQTREPNTGHFFPFVPANHLTSPWPLRHSTLLTPTFEHASQSTPQCPQTCCHMPSATLPPANSYTSLKAQLNCQLLWEISNCSLHCIKTILSWGGLLQTSYIAPVPTKKNLNEWMHRC